MAKELEESQFYGPSRIAGRAAEFVYNLIGDAR
jgi:hypothetical protein